jgi:membrane-associated phospholipid phosphatase
VADVLAQSVNPLPLAIAGLALVAVAVARQRPRVALTVIVVLAASVLTSELLKPLLADTRPREWFGDFSVGGASWPSGHATSSMCLALCAVVVAPRRQRPLAAAVGTALAVGVSFSILVLGWHFPSDVLGGYLVAGTWAALGIAGLRALEQRQRQPRSAARGAIPAGSMLAPVKLAGVGAASVAALAIVRPETVATFASGHPSFVAGALAIAALAWVLTSGLALAMRR